MFSFERVNKEDVKEVFLSGNVLAKTVRTVVDDDRNWDYLLKQIADPKNNRPVKPLDKGVERSRRYNYFLKAWESVVLLNERGSVKETPYTKKMSTTLLPIDGCINLYSHGNYISIGVLFDLTKCNLKQEKYIFNQRVNTDERPWLRHVTQHENQQIIPENVSLDVLKAALALSREKNEIPVMNELLVGLSREAVIGVFVRHDNLLDRLAAYRQRAHIRAVLNKTVPVLLLSSERSYQFISESTIREDIQFALKLADNNPNYHLAKIYIEQFPLTLSKQVGDGSFSFIMKYLTLEEQKQLSLVRENNSNLNDIKHHAESTLERRVHEEAFDFKNLVSEVFQINRHSLDVRSVKEIYQQYHCQLNEKLIALLNDNNPETYEIFKKMAYHLSQQNIYGVMAIIESSMRDNKAILPRVEYLVRLNSQHVLQNFNIITNLITYANESLLFSLGIVTIFNNLFEQSVNIKIFSDVARRSGEEMYYDKVMQATLKVSPLTLAVLYQKESLINILLKNAPLKIVDNTLHELRSLKKFVTQYSSNQYEWDFLTGKKITANELEDAYVRFLKMIYYHKKNFILDKYEKRLLESLLVAVIDSMPTQQRLSELMSKIWVHPIINQRRHPFFDRLVVGEKEVQIKANLRDAAERTMKRMEFDHIG